ncbi:hypothetical protein MMC08_003576 [Hypocenomyce scalaris]|nr:hypothetical protein [Hypocenomyce scalaris]
MASRKGLGFRGGRTGEGEDKLEKVRAETSKRASTLSSASATSKIPTFHSSIFSRANRSRTDTGAARSRTEENPTLSRTEGRSIGGPPSRKEIPAIERLATSRNLGLGIQTAQTPRGLTSPQSTDGRLDGRQRNVLRRKAPSVNQHAQYASTESTSFSAVSFPPRRTVSSPGGYTDSFPGTMLGISMPFVSASSAFVPGVRPMVSEEATSSSRMAHYMSRGQPQKLSSTSFPPPTTSFPAHSSSPSTRYSESPGPFSRTSTPTSMSSHSPGIVLPPSKSAPRPRPLSPTRSRPPVTRRRLGGAAHEDGLDGARTRGLPALRESLTSSSSSSTVKGVDRTEATEVQKARTRSRLSPPPPSPPLRNSSKQFSRTRVEIDAVGEGCQATHSTELRYLDASRPSEDSERQTTASPQASTQRRAPPRPSREGTPRLDDSAPSPVIQSNLNRLVTTGHKRRESVEKATPSSAVGKDMVYPEFATLGRSPTTASTTSRRPARLPSPSLKEMPQRPSQDSQRSGQREIPPLQTDPLPGHTTREPSLLSTNPSKSPSRFGLFSRHTKVPPESPDVETGERLSKKGPAAGTGHEGYGKYARRGRSGSATTNASGNMSMSTSSNTTSAARTSFSRKSSVTSRGDFEIDDFLLSRLAPVIIPGGATVLENRRGASDMFRPSCGESPAGVASSVDTRAASTATATRDKPIGNLPPTVIYNSSSARRGSRSLPQERDILANTERARYVQATDDFNKIPTLATRRSLHRSQTFKEAEPLKIPPPINTRALAPSPLLGSYDTMLSSVPWTDSSIPLTDDISEGREGNWLRPRKAEKRTRSPKRWNFFQRAHASPKTVVRSEYYNDSASVQELPVTISRLPEARSVAHYAMMDDRDQFDSTTLEDLLQDTEDTADDREKEDTWSNNDSAEQTQRQEHKMSMLLPSPPVFSNEFSNQSRPASPPVPLHHGEAVNIRPTVLQPPSLPKPSRLPQVGRIPRVISKRDRLHKPPPQSFSRPFARTPIVEDNSPGWATDNDFPTVQRPILGVQTDFIPSRPFESPGFGKPASAPVAATESFSPVDNREFLVFPPRMGSEVSASSSSGILSFAATTAVLPQPDAALSEDEVWKEYDELLDNVGSALPSNVPRSTTNASRPRLPGKSDAKSSEKIIRTDLEQSLPVFRRQESPPDPQLLLPPITTAPLGALPSPPRGSRLPSPIRSPGLPSTPMSFSDFFAGYGDRSSAGVKDQRLSGLSGSRYSTDSTPSTPTRRGEGQQRNTQLMARKTDSGSGAQTNLRFSALMVSRWLSFGRVLFSPAHAEIQNSRQNRVLVLDGLGNDDWSFYCALTYPSAIVYNLSPFQPTTTTTSPAKHESGAFSSPSNHRQIHHTNIAHPFPFPRGFFTAAVFRFPVGSSDPAYRNAISECKRVLRPGGYLEMSVLDLDMVNMGNRARRAVRMLKLRMQAQDPDVSLQPASDNIQKMLGRRGFENLNRCMVGVPVAGLVSDSRAGSFDENARSLGDMLKDPSRQGDDGITKMVARVGRWWYTRCYEMEVLDSEMGDREEGGGVETIWEDRTMLKECERRETGFKLLICYAQKPVAARRRTVSV